MPTRNPLPAIPVVRVLSFVVALALATAATAWAQTPAGDPETTGLLRVFLDCNACDETYLRQNITFIDYVRDRTVADVHVLVTTQGTGGGGTSWTVNFIGVGSFEGQDRTLAFSTPQTATADDRRTEFARVFRLGIVGYAASTPSAAGLDVTFDEEESESEEGAEPEHDPWNYWVFRINGGGNGNGQQSRTSRSYNLSASASRTTEAWKVNFNGGRNTNISTFELSEGETVKSRRHTWSVNALMVRSVTGKWSIGTRFSAEHSSFSNTDLSLTLAPGLEFDVFPYAESSRRSLTVQYSAGFTRLDYRELTVYDKLEETVPHHAVAASLGLRQPWGSIGAEASVSQHLNALDRRRLSLSGNGNVRLFRGFSFNVFAQYAKISDQIALRKGNATTEDVLLSLQQLRTDYSYFFNFGLSYSFGSIFNSVVNPRFNGSGALSF